MYLWAILVGLLPRRHLRAAGPHRAADSRRHTIMSAEMYNQVFTLHGAVMVFLFIIPAIPAALGQLRPAADARRQGRRLPAAEPAQLLHLCHRRGVRAVGPGRWAASTPAGPSTRPTARPRTAPVTIMTAGRVRPRLLVDPHRPQLHRHDPQAARARHELVPHAAVPLGHVRHRDHPGPGDAGARHHAAPADHGARFGRSASSIRASAATRCCSSTSSGSTRTRPSTS